MNQKVSKTDVGMLYKKNIQWSGGQIGILKIRESQGQFSAVCAGLSLSGSKYLGLYINGHR